jgi:RNA polymerase sigma-70 factor (ECF subfamily)
MPAAIDVSTVAGPEGNFAMIAHTIQKTASDEDLIRAIAGGDRLAMTLLYTRHSIRVFRFALRLLTEDSAAEDLVNEVFLDVWRKAGSFAGHSEVSTWILAIARNKAMSAARRRSCQPLNDDMCETIQDNADNPETVMGKSQIRARLSQCLTNLSPAHREVIDLVYYHVKSIDEIAEIIQVPPNTVKTRMFYARNHLAKLMAEASLDRDLLTAA